ncbi:MAG: cyclic nucleotide-binding domain-containing protein [Methylococcales bacterium]
MSNQEKSECNTTYDPNAALEFFKLIGKLESVNKGEKFFVQGQAGFLSFLQVDKMYLLVDGSVAIQTDYGDIINIESGEIFGEFTPYTRNNATAIANTSCKLLSLSEKQLVASLKKKPEFLFMLMDVLVKYLQKTGAEKNIEKKGASLPTKHRDTKKDAVLSTKMLNDLRQILGGSALTVVPENRVIFQKGAAASLMYVILDGTMTISVGDNVVGRSGAGDIVGEIALVAQHSRTARVVAETRCSLLAINRQTLLELTQALPAFGISLLRVLISRLPTRA